MNKLFTKIFLGVFAVFLFARVSYAANSTSIRLQQPQSPTNLDTFNVIFVVLDTNPDQPVSVQCYKKGPTDGSFVTFGSAISLINGGNTDNCQVDGGIMNQGSGTYQFEAIASGSTNPTSNIVSVDFNNSGGPGNPINYDKTRPDTCTYKISFRTADDSGRTIKVALYRSTDASFSVDSGHQVNSINISSNTDGSMTNNVSPCDITYYYAIRAFDTYGNGSGVVGDQNITTTTTTTTATTTTAGQGAIPVEQGRGGAVLGTTVAPTATEAAKEVLGETKKTVEGEKTTQNPVNWVLTHKKISLLVLFILVCIGAALYLRNKKKAE